MRTTHHFAPDNRPVFVDLPTNRRKALRKELFKYKLHADDELFEKAYSYIRQYY